MSPASPRSSARVARSSASSRFMHAVSRPVLTRGRTARGHPTRRGVRRPAGPTTPVSGKSARKWPPRLSRRTARHPGRPWRPARSGPSLGRRARAGPRRGRRRRGPAPASVEHRAGSGAGDRVDRDRSARRDRGSARRRQVEHEAAAEPPAEDQSLEQAVGGEPVGAVHAGGRDLADGVQPGTSVAPHRSRRRRRTGSARPGATGIGSTTGSMPCASAGGHDGREAVLPDSAGGAWRRARTWSATRGAPRGWPARRRHAARGRPAGAGRP